MGRGLGVFITFLVVAGCGQRGQSLSKNPEIKPYWDRFTRYSKQEGRDPGNDYVEFIMGRLSDREIGMCEQGPLTTPQVTLDSDYWKEASDLEKETLVLHELGHCVLGRDHLDDEVDGRPLSLMHFEPVQPEFYLAHKAEYLYELFHSKGAT